ncbi:MAG: RodZ domain-containing protein [Bacteroidota bacterium]
MPTESLKKFAEELRLCREEKGITLQQIANRTKIDIKYLRAIEEANFDILPELYMRAFIKEYAQSLDCETFDVIKKFDLAKKGIVETAAEKVDAADSLKATSSGEKESAMIEQENDELKSESGKPQKKFILNKNLIYAVSGVAILILVYFVFINQASPDQSLMVTNEPELGNNPRYEVDSSEISQESNIVHDDSLDLVLTTSGRVWCKILKDNKEVFQNFIEANQTKSFRAYKEFRVVVGNAGFVNLKLENKDLNLEHKPGEIRNYIINSDTVKSYILSVPSKNEKRTPAKN